MKKKTQDFKIGEAFKYGNDFFIINSIEVLSKNIISFHHFENAEAKQKLFFKDEEIEILTKETK